MYLYFFIIGLQKLQIYNIDIDTIDFIYSNRNGSLLRG